MALSHAQMQAVLRQAGWPDTHLAIMSAIGMGESSGNPNAVNRGNPPGAEYSVGLWQINMNAHGTSYGTEAQLKDPLTNARAALDVFRAQGFGAWGAYDNGSYKKYLAAAQAAAQTPVAYDGQGATPDPSIAHDSTTTILTWAAIGTAAYFLLFE